MSEILVHVHGTNETYDLEISRYDQLMSEIAKKENIEDETSIQLRVENTDLDDDVDMATLANAHVDVKVSMRDFGKPCQS